MGFERKGNLWSLKEEEREENRVLEEEREGKALGMWRPEEQFIIQNSVQFSYPSHKKTQSFLSFSMATHKDQMKNQYTQKGIFAITYSWHVSSIHFHFVGFKKCNIFYFFLKNIYKSSIKHVQEHKVPEYVWGNAPQP